MPWLHHLAAPGSSSQLLLNRFSPHFNRAGSFGLNNVRPFPAYHHIFPLDQEQVHWPAYYFRFDYAEGAKSYIDAESIQAGCQAWRQASPSAFLFSAADGPELVWILGGRGTKVECRRIAGPAAQVLQACDTVVALQVVRDRVCSAGPQAHDVDLDAVVGELERSGLVFREGTRVIALPIRLDAYALARDDIDAQNRARRVEQARAAAKTVSTPPYNLPI